MFVSNQGALDDRYKLVPRTLIFLSHQDQLLLLKGSPHKRLWANLYNGLGGHIEQGEDILSAARRELAEEGGHPRRPALVVRCDNHRHRRKNRGWHLCYFAGRLICPTFSHLAREFRNGFPSNSFVKAETLPLVEDLPVLLPHVLGSKPTGRAFSAHYRALPGETLEISFYSET